MDMTGVTLAQIKESIKFLPGKFDKNLETPLKQAKDRFRTALNMISHKNQKRAFVTFNDVIDHATQAFYYMDSNDMTITDLEACAQAVQLLVFSKIARYCYDESSESFLPFLTHSMEDKAMTATELMDIVDRFFENISSDPSTKVQDTLNTILQATYPFISEGHEWTMSTTKFDLQVNTVKVKVMPKYVPMEEKDKTTLILGVYIQKKKCQRIFIWRSEDTINVSGYGNYSRKISSETEIVEFSINHFLVISSEGGAAQYQSGSLGQYCYDPNTGYYIQTSTEKGHEKYLPQYIYHLPCG